VLLQHRRVERAVAFDGMPEDPVLSGGGQALTFGIGNYVVAWPVGPRTRSQILMAIPPGWVTLIVAAGSPTDALVMAAGGADDAPWVRSVSVADGSSRLLATGDAIGGRPVAGAVTPDGRRFVLVVARPDPEEPDDVSRWRLIDVGVADGDVRETGLAGTIRVPLQGLRADFTDDAGSFVMWDGTATTAAALVDIAGKRQTEIPVTRGPVASAGFRAIPSGAAQLWFDGTVALIDREGATGQRLDLHTARVRDVVVSPDGTWAATAGDGGEVIRWNLDPASGIWSGPEYLPGHDRGVVGLQAAGDGRRLFSVSQDGTAIVWDMRAEGGLAAERAGRSSLVPPSAWLEDACAVVGRDFTPAEWRRYLPDRPFQPTCTDLP
jgi:WD40 repeat protein